MKSYCCVTGATGGLGRAFAVECAQRGWNVFLTDLPGTPLQELAEGLERQHGIGVRWQASDLMDPTQREAFWRYVGMSGTRFHALVNVAGVEYEGPFMERTLLELRSIVRLNIEATMEMTHNVLTHRDPCRTLRIINVSSLASFYPMPTKAVYAASKRFLLDFSRALQRELAGEDVMVTVLCPAGLPTTKESLEKIGAQGIMGQATTMNVGYVASKTLDAACAGRSVYIPGLVNRVLRALSAMLPTASLTGIIQKRWKKVSSEAGGSVDPFRSAASTQQGTGG